MLQEVFLQGQFRVEWNPKATSLVIMCRVSNRQRPPVMIHARVSDHLSVDMRAKEWSTGKWPEEDYSLIQGTSQILLNLEDAIGWCSWIRDNHIPHDDQDVDWQPVMTTPYSNFPFLSKMLWLLAWDPTFEGSGFLEAHPSKVRIVVNTTAVEIWVPRPGDLKYTRGFIQGGLGVPGVLGEAVTQKITKWVEMQAMLSLPPEERVPDWGRGWDF